MTHVTITRFSSLIFLTGTTLAMLTGCKPDLLPGTNIEDTSDNRAVVEFVEEYRTVVESRSADAVLDLVAEDYFEDQGTATDEDDYGIEKLREDLDKHFQHADVIQLKVEVQHISYYPEKELVHVYYRYLQRAHLKLPAGNQWVTDSDTNRLVLRQKGMSPSDGLVIVAGL